MADVVGERMTDNVAQSQRTIDLFPEIMLLEPEAAPITVILRSIYNSGRRRKTNDPMFSWHEDELAERIDLAASGAAADDVTITATTAIFADDDLVFVPSTGEVMRVTEAAGVTLTVIRGVGDTTGAVIAADAELYIIGTAASEGSESEEATSNNPVKVTNYTQIVKNSIEASGTWRSTANESTPHDWGHQHRKESIEHEKTKELAFLHGSPSADAGGGTPGPVRTTGGLDHYLTENIVDAAGALTEEGFEDCMRAWFRYGSSTKTLFASPLIISQLSLFALGKVNTTVGQTTYGVRVQTYYSPHGTLNLVKHNLLEGEQSGNAYCVDFVAGNVQYRYLDGSGAPGGSRDTRLYTDRQSPGLDGQRDEIISEVGLQCGLPKTGGRLTGVTGS